MDIQYGQWVKGRNNIIKTAFPIMDSNIRSPNSIYMIMYYDPLRLYTRRIRLNAFNLKHCQHCSFHILKKRIREFKSNRFPMRITLSLMCLWACQNAPNMKNLRGVSRTRVSDKYLILSGLEPESYIPSITRRSCSHQLPIRDC